MRRYVCLPLALLFLASVVPSYAQSEASTTAEPADEATSASGSGATEVVYDVRGLLTVNCTDLASPGQKLVWWINSTELQKLPEAQRKRVAVSEAGVLTVSRATEDDFGNYSCAAAGASREFAVRGRPHARMHENANVVEGHKLKLTCRLTGKPYPGVEWVYANSSEARSVPVTEALGGRVQLNESEQGVPEAQLVLPEASRTDAGFYTCRPLFPGHVNATTQLRVKDKYAALWPFLGICAEVFVLCAIILVYEKRRTKPELDDSDTDNHDQKKS